MKAVMMGDFYGAMPEAQRYKLHKVCAVEGCDRLINDRARHCKQHASLLHYQVEAQVQRLCEMARERRGREMCRRWWEVTR